MSGETILIVEDNADLVSILQQLLEPEYRVLTARRGEDGIELARRFHPELVILDVQLPGMDGMEAGRWIKRELGDTTSILVLTALAGKRDAEAILAAGCCDCYLAKPAPLAVIRAKVEELLGRGTGVA